MGGLGGGNRSDRIRFSRGGFMLDAFCAVFFGVGGSWCGLGRSWGGLGVVLGALGAVLGPLGAVLWRHVAAA